MMISTLENINIYKEVKNIFGNDITTIIMPFLLGTCCNCKYTSIHFKNCSSCSNIFCLNCNFNIYLEEKYDMCSYCFTIMMINSF